jgi:L-fuculose-phosphate aldolase
MQDEVRVLCEELIMTGAYVARAGLVAGGSGNISVKASLADSGRTAQDMIIITGRGSQLANLSFSDLAITFADGSIGCAELQELSAQPSSELPMHRSVYDARPDVAAIIHTHSPQATAAAACHLTIPAFLDELTFMIGGHIATSEYAPPGSVELGANIVKALGDRQAALIANHGAIAVGSTLSESMKVAVVCEEAARVYAIARGLGGPMSIPESALERQKAGFRRRKGLI